MATLPGGGGHSDILVYTCLNQKKMRRSSRRCNKCFVFRGSENIDFQEKGVFLKIWQV